MSKPKIHPDCRASHTCPQVPDSLFHCPECYTRCECISHGPVFTKSKSCPDSDLRCDALHVWDELECETCGYKARGYEYAGQYYLTTQPTNEPTLIDSLFAAVISTELGRQLIERYVEAKSKL